LHDGTRKKRRKALFSWGLWNEHDLLAEGQPSRLDVAELPGQQQAEEQNHREPDPNGEGARHPAALGATPRLARMPMKASATRNFMTPIIGRTGRLAARTIE
jgi:hypothetical protein